MSGHDCSSNRRHTAEARVLKKRRLGVAVLSTARSEIWRLPDASSGGGSTESQYKVGTVCTDLFPVPYTLPTAGQRKQTGLWDRTIHPQQIYPA
jgi:hypothetical protein